MFSCKDKGFEEVELSDEMKEQIALDFHDEYYYAVFEKGRFSCYGKYKNIYFICSLTEGILAPDYKPDVIQEFDTKNSHVKIYSSYLVFGYLDHYFYDIEVLYTLGIVSEKALLEFSDYTKDHKPSVDLDVWEYLYTNKN